MAKENKDTRPMLASEWPIPAVGAIIERADGRVFLTKSPKWSNKWVMPGGKVKEGECIEEALVREMKEETGLEVCPAHILGVTNGIYPKNYYKKAHFIFIHFLCKITGGVEKIDHKELTASKWVTLEQAINAMDVDEYTLDALKILAKIRGLADSSAKAARDVRIIKT